MLMTLYIYELIMSNVLIMNDIQAIVHIYKKQQTYASICSCMTVHKCYVINNMIEFSSIKMLT